MEKKNIRIRQARKEDIDAIAKLIYCTEVDPESV